MGASVWNPGGFSSPIVPIIPIEGTVGVQTSTISIAPYTVLSSSQIDVIFDGLLLAKSDYSASGTDLIFTVPIQAGTQYRIQLYLSEVLPINTASLVSFAPTPLVSSTNVQAAIEELSVELFESVSLFKYFTSAQIADVLAGTLTLDVTAAIQAAHDALPATGGDIYGPAGSYRLSGPIVITKPNVSFRCAGRKVTRFFQYTPASKVFNTANEYFTLSGCSIEYVTAGTAGGTAVYNNNFYGNYSRIYVKAAHVAYHFDTGANSHTLSNCDAENYVNIGIWVKDAANVMYSSGFLLCSNTSTLGMLGAVRLENKVEGCNFTDVQTYQGVYTLTAEAAVYGVGTRPAYNKFNSMYFDSAANSALINECVETEFNNCWFSNRPGSGAIIQNSSGIHFNGGGAVNCAQHGMIIQNTATRVTFTGFSARGNGTTTPNTYDGISVSAGTTDFLVTNSTLGGNTVMGFGTQRYGINVLAGASDRYVISQNLIGDNGTGGVLDNGAGVNKLVANNY